MSDLDAILLGVGQPIGVPAAADRSLVTIGTVLAVDAAGHTVQVALRGDLSAVVTLPAVAARYRLGGSCHILHNPLDGGRAVRVFGAVDPLPPAVLGTLVTPGSSPSYLATVTVFGSNYSVPFSGGTYTAQQRVWIELDSWGVPFRMDGFSPESTPTTGPTAPGAGGGSGTAQATVSIGAQWSGTWRASRSAYDRYNADRPEYGGRSTLYQGQIGSSSTLTGIAVYGDQLVNLGATSFDRIQVAVRPVGASGASGDAVLQGTAQATAYPGAPAPGGDTATGLGWVDLPASMRENFRTGASKGLVTVGGNYQAVAGAGNGDGMLMVVTYTRPA